MLFNILHKRWGFNFVPQSQLPPDSDGECDPPDKKNKRIKVHNKLGDERTLAILIHEMLHAADWYKDESWVEMVAEQIARAATRLGYKRDD